MRMGTLLAQVDFFDSMSNDRFLNPPTPPIFFFIYYFLFFGPLGPILLSHLIQYYKSVFNDSKSPSRFALKRNGIARSPILEWCVITAWLTIPSNLAQRFRFLIKLVEVPLMNVDITLR